MWNEVERLVLSGEGAYGRFVYCCYYINYFYFYEFLLEPSKGRNELEFKRIFTEKEGRYRLILVFMSAVLDEENHNHISTGYKPFSKGEISEYCLNELKSYHKSAKLHAPKIALDAIDEFIDNLTDSTYDAAPDDIR